MSRCTTVMLMMRTTPLLREVAERLLTIEDRARSEGESAATRVCGKLKELLGRLLGSGGFWALLSRALALAQAEARELHTVELKPDGALVGFKEDQRQAEVVLVAHILGLLVTFIGSTLTISLLRDVWPKAAIEQLDQGKDA